MHCDEFERRLNDLLDRRIAPDDDSGLCSHARRCGQCADSMAAHLALAAALKDLPPAAPDETFPFAVMSRWERTMGGTGKHSLPVQSCEPPEQVNSSSVGHGQTALARTALARATQRRQWITTSLVTAAAVLVAFTLWRGGINPNSPSATPGSLVNSTEFLPGYERLAAETQQLATLFTTRQLEVMSELAEGIKPVATSFGAAYHALRRTIPGSDSTASATSG